jgi:SAM-dependent methyltransferase
LTLIDKYGLLLEQQKENAYGNAALRHYLEYLYTPVLEKLQKNQGAVLELGAGAGISKIFLGEHRVVRTDYLQLENESIIGGVDASCLAFGNETFDFVFGIDMLHHVTNPIQALLETTRILRSTSPTHLGSALFIEPFVSSWSYPIYKLFHPERTSWKLGMDQLVTATTINADDGDQCVGKAIMQNWPSIQDEYPELRQMNLEITLMHPISFFFTGGINRPFPVPLWIVRSAISLENRFHDQINRKFAARMILTLTKKHLT